VAFSQGDFTKGKELMKQAVAVVVVVDLVNLAVIYLLESKPCLLSRERSIHKSLQSAIPWLNST
jgi:hypothetical protein